MGYEIYRTRSYIFYLVLTGVNLVMEEIEYERY